MSEARPPSLRGTDRVVFLVGAAVVLTLQLYALWRVPGPATPAPPAPLPASQAEPVARLGTPDPAGILWFTVTADGVSPSSAIVRANVAVQIRLRNTATEPRTFSLRAEADKKTVQTWAPIAAGAEAGESLTLPQGRFVLDGGGQSAFIEAR